MFSYSQREELGHNYKQIKAKFNSVKSSVSDVWDSVMIVWAPKGLAVPLLQLVSQLIYVPGGCLMVLASPACWGLHHMVLPHMVLTLRISLQPLQSWGFSWQRRLYLHKGLLASLQKPPTLLYDVKHQLLSMTFHAFKTSTM